jgi:hypothetical protein
MITEPESWLGLRSERVVAGDFDAPVAARARRQRPNPDAAAPVSWREVRSGFRRTLWMLLGR